MRIVVIIEKRLSDGKLHEIAQFFNEWPDDVLWESFKLAIDRAFERAEKAIKT